jgi:hypothetical protein
MKILSFLLAVCLAFGVTAQAQTRKVLGEDSPKTAPDPTPDYLAICEGARKLYAAGKLDEAMQQVEVVLAKYPHYTPAVTLRSQLDRSIRADTSRELRARLDRIVIPRVNFQEALIESTLDFLRDETRRLDRNGKGVNIVVLLPDEIKKRKISLDLIDARASDVLEYLAEGAGFRYRLERSAVVVTAKDPTTQPAPSAVAASPAGPEIPTIPGAGIPGVP